MNLEPGQPRKLVIVSQNPLTVHAFKQIDVESIRDARMELEIWECSNLIPGMQHLAARSWPAIPGQVRLESYDRLTQRVQGLRSSDTVIFRGGTYAHQMRESPNIYEVVARGRARLATIDMGQIPSNLPSRLDPMSLAIRARRKATDLVVGGNALSRVKGWMSAKVSSPSHDYPRIVQRPLDFVWAGPYQTAASSPLTSETTVVRLMHTFDYEKVNDLADHRQSPENLVVLLDSIGPQHPDHQTRESHRYGISQDFHDHIFLGVVNRFAEQLDGSVAIACHPRAPLRETQERFRQQEVYAGVTHKLISAASLIVDIAGSTAIGQSAVLRRPLVMLTHPGLPVVTRQLQADIRRWTGYSLMDVRSIGTVPSANLLTVPDTSRYVDRFMCRSDGPKRRIWDQIMLDLGET